MAIVEIPISSDSGNYNFQTELDGTDYILRFRYNGRSTSWYMDMSTPENAPIIMGIKIVVGTELLSSFKHLAIPQGIMYAVNLENVNQEPTRNNFGSEIRLVYNEVA